MARNVKQLFDLTWMKTIAYNTSKGACITFTKALAAE